MKREFLRNFKVGEAELPKEVIDAILDENSSDIEAVKAKYADYDTVKAQLVEADKTIAGFKGMDIDAVRREADEWKGKAIQAGQEAAAKIADMEFSGRINSAIAGAKGKNAKAVMALLDLDALKASKNQEADIKTALEGLQKDSGYLFDTERAHRPPTRTGQGAPQCWRRIPKRNSGRWGIKSVSPSRRNTLKFMKR